MHGHHETSVWPRAWVTAIHLGAVGGASWILSTGDGDPWRRAIVLGMAVIYLLRSTFGTLVLLRRQFGWSEAAIVATLFVALHGTFSVLGSQSVTALSWLDAVGVVAFVVGSYLNTASEFGRHRFKQDPRNRGKLYTDGLFRHSMHINYFGDSLLFTGFAVLTGTAWALVVPAIMTAGFVFQHIPTLDKYLAERYGSAFEAYARRTKKFVPYVW